MHKLKALIVVAFAVSSGCAHSSDPRSTDARPSSARNAPEKATGKADNDATPVAKIYQADYDPKNNDNGRKIAVVVGEGFKLDPTADDCQTTHDNGATWTPCKQIIEHNGSRYKFETEDGAMFRTVYVKVRGTDGEWSKRKLINKLPPN